MTGRLTEAQCKLLSALTRFSNEMATACDIAYRMGYRPSRKAIPAVSSMCRAINRKFPSAETNEFAEVGEYLVRIPPRDRWASAMWCLTPAGRAALKHKGSR